VNVLSAVGRQVAGGDGVLVAALLLLVTAIAGRAALLFHVRGAGRRLAWYTRAAWQFGALLGLEQAYEFTRGRIPYTEEAAYLRAYHLLDLEWRHGFFVEQRIQAFFLHFHLLMTGIDLFYAVGHVGITIGVLIWIYVKHREWYPFARNLFAVSTAIALVSFYFFPTAPPRFFPNYGFVDPAVSNHLVNAGEAQPSSYTYNPYAAMPSLHVAYALVVALSAFLADRRVWVRGLAVVYPVVMAAVVIISGNHWLLDVAGAAVTVAIAACILLAWGVVRPIVLNSLKGMVAPSHARP
jgi:membrane-associated phospholipid phosphatase